MSSKSKGRSHNRLTARSVTTVTKPGRYADGGGLYLTVAKDGSRRWTFIWMREGKSREMGLGGMRGTEAVTLAEARRRADQVRLDLADGLDPIQAREARRAAAEAENRGPVTFGEVAEQVLAARQAEAGNAKHADQWALSLRTYAAPLRDKPVAEITVADVLACLKDRWTSTPETSRRLRQRIEAVLDASIAAGHRTSANPAFHRVVAHFLPKIKTPGIHHRALAYREVPPFMAALREQAGMGARALEFAALTAARTGEVVGARWPEIDLDAAVWTVPASRMKAAREHRVPLVGRALEIVQGQSALRTSDLVFPGTRSGTKLSDMTLLAVLKRMAVNSTTHGFRSSFRDWAGDQTNFQREVIEAALAHSLPNKTEAAYRRSDALEKRRQLMEAWDAYCMGASVKITPMRA